MLTETERQNLFDTAIAQLRRDRVAQLSIEDVEAIRVIREARCAECLDRDSDPKYDLQGGMVCDICGAEWRGIVR